MPSEEDECMHKYVRVDSGTDYLIVLSCVKCDHELFVETHDE